MQTVVQLLFMPISSSAAKDIHALNPASLFIVILLSIACLFIAGMSAWAWHTTEQRRLWFQAEVDRRRELVQAAKDDLQAKIDAVEEEMARLQGKVKAPRDLFS